MKTTLIFAHPYEGSFGRALLDRAAASLENPARIDLYADGFNPALSAGELAIYNEGKSSDPLVARYNAILDETERAALIFPIWWYDMPAMLRGFFDKVMLAGSAYAPGEGVLRPLRSIRPTHVITTSFASTEALIRDFGDPIRSTLIPGTLRAVGFEDVSWHNLGNIDGTTPGQRQAFLDEIGSLFE